MPYRIADRKEARDVDRIAYEVYSLTELELMENAGRASAHLAEDLPGQHPALGRARAAAGRDIQQEDGAVWRT